MPDYTVTPEDIRQPEEGTFHVSPTGRGGNRKARRGRKARRRRARKHAYK